jgi:hypothetical protein
VVLVGLGNGRAMQRNWAQTPWRGKNSIALRDNEIVEVATVEVSMDASLREECSKLLPSS